MSKKVVYDISELNSYCSEEHLIASQFFMAQLDDTPAYLRSLASLKPIVLYHENIDSSTVKIQEKMQELVIVEKNVDDKKIETKKVEENKIEKKEEKNNVQVENKIEKKQEKKEEKKVVQEKNVENKIVEKPVSNQIEGYTPAASSSLAMPKIPKNVVPQLSNFGTCYMTLDRWKTIDTMNYLDDKVNKTIHAFC